MTTKEVIGLLGIFLLIVGVALFGFTAKQFINDVEYTLNSMNQELKNKTNIIENQEKEMENLKVLNKQLLEEKELLSITSEYLEGKLYLNYLVGSLSHQKYLFDSGESINRYTYLEELNDFKISINDLEELNTKLLDVMPNGTIEYLPASINTKELVKEQIKAYNYLLSGYNLVLEEAE